MTDRQNAPQRDTAAQPSLGIGEPAKLPQRGSRASRGGKSSKAAVAKSVATQQRNSNRARRTVRKNQTVAIPDAWAPHVVSREKSGRALKHPTADWITNPDAFGLPRYETEYRFHESRRWRFDYCWPDHRVAVEIEGGSGKFGRHSRPGGMRNDAEKYNAAVLQGWKVLRVLRGEELRLSTLQLIHEALR